MAGHNGRQMAVERITPLAAERILRDAAPNRLISRARVAVLASAMRAGQWTLTGETIIFDDAGRLLDGQHRLAACALAGVAFETYVARGVSPNAIMDIDSGRARRYGDVLAIRGVSSAVLVAASVGWLQRLLEGPRAIKGGDIVRPNAEREALRAQYPDLIDSLRVVSAKPGRAVMAGSARIGPYTALRTILMRSMPGRAEPFFDGLISGVDLASDSPIRLLRERLLTEGTMFKGVRRPPWTPILLGVRAWNAYATGTTRLRLTHKTVDGEIIFPAIIGGPVWTEEE